MRAIILLVAFGVGLAATVAVGQRSVAPAGFVELQRAHLSGDVAVDLVMGLVERDGKSTSGKHHHPGGEFGLVISGEIVVDTEAGPARTLQSGDSFFQPPGEWHTISTGAGGTRTVVFRVVKSGEPMVVPVK